MRAKFVEFDTNNDNVLDFNEFQRLLADTSLCLSTDEIRALHKKADLNKGALQLALQLIALLLAADSVIDMDEFMTFAFDTLLDLVRDVRALLRMLSGSDRCSRRCWRTK